MFNQIDGTSHNKAATDHAGQVIQSKRSTRNEGKNEYKQKNNKNRHVGCCRPLYATSNISVGENCNPFAGQACKRVAIFYKSSDNEIILTINSKFNMTGQY